MANIVLAEQEHRVEVALEVRHELVVRLVDLVLVRVDLARRWVACSSPEPSGESACLTMVSSWSMKATHSPFALSIAELVAAEIPPFSSTIKRTLGSRAAYSLTIARTSASGEQSSAMSSSKLE